MGLYFGTDGIRGVANGELTPDVAFKCGNALARAGAKKIIVGRDTRQSGDMLTLALAAGATSGGCDVDDVGVLPTPGIAFLTEALDARFGVVISASHNPPEFNGIKIFSDLGIKLSDTEEGVIESYMSTSTLAESGNIGRYCQRRATEIYRAFLADSVKGSLSGLKFVLDCSNGATSKTAPKVFSALGAEIIPLSCRTDGKSINQNCGSLHPENAAQKVLDCHADAGFCFDGDGDRLIAVDEKGRIVDGDEILYALAVLFKGRKLLKNDVAVGTSHTNMGVEKALAKEGISLLRADIGDKYVNALMSQKGASLGGEQSGHIIIRHLLSTGDGVLTALQLAAELKNKKMSELCSASLYPQTNIDIVVKDKMLVINHTDLWNRVAKLSDGFDGRILVRASGTEPKIRIMTECSDAEKGRKAASELAELVKNI